MQRRFTVEGVAIHGTPNLNFANRATAFGAGLRYNPVWSALMRIDQSGGTDYEKVIEHSWFVAAHVLFAQIGPDPACDRKPKRRCPTHGTILARRRPRPRFS